MGLFFFYRILSNFYVKHLQLNQKQGYKLSIGYKKFNGRFVVRRWKIDLDYIDLF